MALGFSGSFGPLVLFSLGHWSCLAWQAWEAYFQITHPNKVSPSHLQDFSGICDLEKLILALPPHCILVKIYIKQF